MSNRALAFTADHLLRILKSFPVVRSYIVGFSGGADSTALLHAISGVRLQLGVPVSAVHVNHSIHQDADAWQRQCEDFCQQHDIKLICLKVVLKNCSGKGLEAEARHLRYEAVSDLLKPEDCLLTAHHADDQAETLLLNLMRGSGVDGLTAMPECRPLGQGFLQRPLLRFQNTALKNYLLANSIEWTEDPSNHYLNHDRNFVRHKVIPLLEQRWPQVNQRLLLTRDAMTDARQLLESLADDYLDANLSHPFVLNITKQCRTNPKLVKLVIRRWVKQSGVPGVPAYKLDSFCDQLRLTGSDHKVSVLWEGWRLRWYKNQLWLHTSEGISPCPVITWPKGHSEVDLGSDVGKLVLITETPSSDWSERRGGRSPDGEFSVNGRGDTRDAVISLGGHHKSLKNLFQSNGIPPWLRESIPLCKLDGELVALGDWCFNEGFASWLSENGIRLKWRPGHPLLQYLHTQQHPVNH